jgi:hypothetical protein
MVKMIVKAVIFYRDSKRIMVPEGLNLLSHWLALGNWPHYYKVVRSKLMSYNVLTTSINNTHIKRKNSKTTNTSETISSGIFVSAGILRTLGVKYEIRWALRHCDPVNGECPVASYKQVKVGLTLWSMERVEPRQRAWNQGVSMEPSGHIPLSTSAWRYFSFVDVAPRKRSCTFFYRIYTK